MAIQRLMPVAYRIGHSDEFRQIKAVEWRINGRIMTFLDARGREIESWNIDRLTWWAPVYEEA
jgi:hypothetical protein